MPDIIFIVPALPVAQPRQRHRIAGHGGKQFVQNYTPAKDPVNAFKSLVQLAFAQAYQGAPLADPLRVTIDAVFARPKAIIWKTRAMPRLRHTSKPDADNLAKGTTDALNGIAWQDDAQICELRVRKWIAAGDEAPHVTVRIERIEG